MKGLQQLYIRVLKAIAVVVAFGLLFMALLKVAPFPELDAFMSRAVSVRIFDRHNQLISVIPAAGGMRAESLPLEEIPDRIQDTFVSAEDRRFRSHLGIDPIAIGRSALQNVRANEVVSGGSTIPMQLASLVSAGSGYSGKIKEMFDALRISAKLSKDEVLALWLNSLPFSYNTVGVASAARRFFDTDLSDLTLAQAAVLAVIPRSPSSYNPMKNPKAAYSAAVRISRQADLGLSEEEIRAAVDSAAWGEWADKAPHFSLFLTQNEPAVSKRLVPSYHSSLDLDIQRFVQRELREAVYRYRPSRITNGAAIVMRNTTREILAYVGSHDFGDVRHAGQIDGLHVPNPPGSALKPLLFAAALDNGFLPNDILPDIPTTYGGSALYEPMNFNQRFNGPVTFRVALASSLNVPAVYLLKEIGLPRFGAVLANAGIVITDKHLQDAGLGAALGNIEVPLIALTQAFMSIVGGGVVKDASWKAGGNAGNVERRIFSGYSAGVIRDILADSSSRFTGFGDVHVFSTIAPSIVKTGTSDQFQNIWALGSTQDITVGVWMGNHSGNTVIGRTGSSVPARIAVHIIDEFSSQSGQFRDPPDAALRKVCALSGKAPGRYCPMTYSEYLPRAIAINPCDFHVALSKVELPRMYDEWSQSQHGVSSVMSGLHIISPTEGMVFYIDPNAPRPSVEIPIVIAGSDEPIEITLNNDIVEMLRQPGTWWMEPEPGIWEIIVKQGSTTDSVTITIR